MLSVVVSIFVDVVLLLVGALRVFLVAIVGPLFHVQHRHVGSL